MIQEHNLVETEAKKAEVLANRMDITARFSPPQNSGRGGGTAILIKQALVSEIKFKSTKGGSATLATFEAFKKKWEFLSVYGPQDPAKRKNFYSSREFTSLITGSTHVGGDMNTIPNIGLDHWSLVTDNYPNIGSKELEAEMKKKGLRDELRHTLGPSAKIFTRDAPTVRTRLDRWYIPSKKIEMQYSVDIDASWASDHYGVSMKVAITEKNKRGPGRLRIDPSLFLEDNVRREILDTYKRIYTKYPIERWGKTVVFEKFKNSMMSVVTAYSKSEKREKRRDIQMAEDQLRVHEILARDQPPSQEIVDSRKRFQLELKRTIEKYRPPNVWSAHMNVKRAEKASTAFCKQFKKPFKPQYVEELWKTPDWNSPEEKEEFTIDQEGVQKSVRTEITKPKEILKEATGYYIHTTLWKKNN